MTQTSNRFFDEMAKLMTDAAGAAQGMRQEFETVMRAQADRVLADMDVVRREEFEAVKAMAEKAREENERLAKRLAQLERAGEVAKANDPILRPARNGILIRNHQPKRLPARVTWNAIKSLGLIDNA